MLTENTMLLTYIRVKHAVEQLSSKSIRIVVKYSFSAFLVSTIFHMVISD
jgi:hypothetical protein